MVVESRYKMKERWDECLGNWETINEKMRDIWLPEFGMPKNFVDLNNVIKQLVEHDRKFKVDALQITTLERGQVKKFVAGPIVALVVLRYLSTKMDRFKH